MSVPADSAARHAAEVQLWRFFYDDTWDAALATAFDALITPQERQRVQAFRFEKHQRQCLAARALVRTVLSQHAPEVAPADWRFGADAKGKPFVAQPLARGLHFNLAHTEGLVVCAVSHRLSRLGVDAEAFGRQVDATDIAASHFAPSENALLHSLPPARQHQAFLRLWSLKEAFIKATGDGLSTSLRGFSFGIQPNTSTAPAPESPAIRFEAPSPEQAGHWRFAQWGGDRFVVALGADTGGLPLACRVFDTVPLRGHAEQPALGFRSA